MGYPQPQPVKQRCPSPIPLWVVALGVVCLRFSAAGAAAQILVDLVVEGPTVVFEHSYADYTATAVFNDGREFEVTLFCDWSVDPNTYASIDQFGRLTTQEVPQDQPLVVSASFTWDQVTLDDALDVTIVDVPDDPEGDPWPEWQRTASRLGRTSTIGPQTPTIAWRVRVDPGSSDDQLHATPLMDGAGRVFCGHDLGIAVVDSITHEVIWQIEDLYGVTATPSLWKDLLLYGTAEDVFHCVDTQTREEIWSRPAEPHPNRGNVVGANAVVYYASQLNVLYARRVGDGSEVWTHDHPDFFNSAPALDGLGQLYIGNVDLAQFLAFYTADAEIAWAFPLLGQAPGTSAVENSRVYVASPGTRLLYCIDAETGQEIWSFYTEVTAGGGAAVRHDGVIHTIASGGSGWLFAVTPDGQELWRYPITNQSVNHPPIVDGAGNVYFGTYWANSEGWVHAVRPDGTGLWVQEMPDQVSASPMLAPDGTLYVICKDKYLYAFKDPLRPDSVEPAGVSEPAVSRPLPP